MERDEAHKEHGQNQEHICTHLSFGLLRLSRRCSAWRPASTPHSAVGAHAGVGSVQLFSDESVAHNHRHQVSPENNLADVIDDLVPGEPGLCFQVAALEIGWSRSFFRKDHVGQAEEQKEGPDCPGQELTTGQARRIGAPKRFEGLPAAVNADEAKEEDADVHGEVEEHGGNPAHEYTQACGSHVGVW